MHHRNPMKISQPPLPTQPRFLIYDNLSKQELIALLKTRDQELTENKELLRIAQNEYNQKMGIFKLKIQDEIAQNQKAVRAFGSITEIIITIISKFQGFDRVTDRESLVSLANTLRDSIGSRPGSFSKSLNQDLNQSEFSCIDEIATETIKLLDYLTKLTEDMIKVNINLKAEFAHKFKATQPKSDHFSKNQRTPNQVQAKLIQYQSILKQEKIDMGSLKESKRLSDGVIRTWKEELAYLKQEIQLKVYEGKKLKKLLQQQELRRLDLLKSIAGSLQEQSLMRISNMSKAELIEHIKLMNYRTRELEKDKRQMFARSKVDRELDQKKFQDLLAQFKQLKTKRINMSAG